MKIFKTYEKPEGVSGDGFEMALRVTYLYTGTTEEITKVENALKALGRTTITEVNTII